MADDISSAPRHPCSPAPPPLCTPAPLHILVTGGAGFLGRHVVQTLRRRGLSDHQIIVPRRADYDLRRWEAIQQLFADVTSGQWRVAGGG